MHYSCVLTYNPDYGLASFVCKVRIVQSQKLQVQSIFVFNLHILRQQASAATTGPLTKTEDYGMANKLFSDRSWEFYNLVGN